MRAVCAGGCPYEMVVLISTHRDERVEHALDKARETGCGQIVTLFADQLTPTLCDPSEEGEAEA